MGALNQDAGDRCTVDPRVVRILEQRHGKILDASYLAYIERQPDGIPDRQYFADTLGAVHRIGRFLPLIDNHSELSRPFQRSSEFPTRDARVERGVLTLIEEEAPAAFGLFGAESLLPFASLYRGSLHPDLLSLGNADVDLLVFVYGSAAERPQIAVWRAPAAQVEYCRWAGAFDKETQVVRYDLFTVAVAQSFGDFLVRLHADPAPVSGSN